LDFYGLVNLLKKTFTAEGVAVSPKEDGAAAVEREQNFQAKKNQLRQELREKLPLYIVRAIDYVTEGTEAPIGPPLIEEVQGADVIQSNQ
jgi:hypothetical protein